MKKTFLILILFSLILTTAVAQKSPLLACQVTGLSPTPVYAGASGGQTGITVTTVNNCTNYIVTNTLNWVTYTKSSLTVTITVAANTGAARNGEISIGAISLPISQACGNYPVTPGSISVDRNNFCSNAGGNITLTVVGGSGTYTRWFSGSCGGTQVGYTSGSSISIPAPTSTTTYYGRWETSCSNSTCKSITVNVNQAPVLSISGTTPVCPGSTYRYTASSSGLTTYNWSLPSGASGSSSTYYIDVTFGTTSGNVTVSGTDPNGCTSNTATYGVTVNSLYQYSVIGGGDNLSRCWHTGQLTRFN